MNTDIILRKWQYEDVDALLELGKNPTIKHEWDPAFPYPSTRKKAKACIDFFLSVDPVHVQIDAVVIDDKLCGWIQCEHMAYQCGRLSYGLDHMIYPVSILYEIIRQKCQISFLYMDIMTIYIRILMEDRRILFALLNNGFIESKETAPIYLYFLHSYTMNDVMIKLNMIQ